MITKLQPIISTSGIRYILDNEGREIASISSLLDGVDNAARAKESEYIHNAICDGFNRLAALEAENAKLRNALITYHAAADRLTANSDDPNAWEMLDTAKSAARALLEKGE